MMSEAAKAVIDQLLRQPTITGVEAWIDSRNLRSIGVARNAGLDLAGRVMRVYHDHEIQSVVMARAAEPRDPMIIGVRPTLLVRDIDRTLDLLVGILGMHVRFRIGNELVRVGLTEWTNGNGIDLRPGHGGKSSVGIDLGVAVDPIYRAVVADGWQVGGPPQDMPWFRREFMVTLPEGHELKISGSLRPKSTRSNDE